MVGWLIYSAQDIEKNNRYIQFYMNEGLLRNIKIQLIIAEELVFGVRKNQWFLSYQNEEISHPDFAICRTIYPLLNKQLEYMGIPVFNNSHIAEICNDKAKTYQYIAQLGIPMVDSKFVKYPFIKKELTNITEPTVIKAVAGHGGSQVFLLKPADLSVINDSEDGFYRKLNNSDVVIQPLVGFRHQDLRVYVIGNEIIASVLRTAREGFKSNFSLGGEVKRYELSSDDIQLVKKIISKFDFGMVGIDFIIGDKEELIFNEIEDVVGARMLYQTGNINLVGLYLDYIRSKI
ncbi:ATP-grasp domain-containing protein [Anaerocolumna sedimenticola]|uniref:ATP-grasp domain-containing protein n=1 Tax=Anaerocolumna sedimenticola TaxID=2696063 RepID=A0A6P1TMB3_9FIRM|nr:ATP-grasp domain-containing protein [Anaerocolumna sedimenticola]QHQ62164.1 ATP-grasp domain-containing protein [Anaerocolumna sedimenticola]